MSTLEGVVCPHAVRPADERANFVTHAFGLILAISATWILMRRIADVPSLRLQISCAVYCFTLVTLYAASTLSHAFQDLTVRRFFRTVDQACIFTVIAGTFTPFGVIRLWHGMWPLLLVSMWVFASAGILMCIVKRNLSGTARVSYLVMGWLPVICLRELAATTEPAILFWIMAGGLCYCIGVVFLTFDRIRYFHAVWHLLVICGSAFHFTAITQYVITA